MIFKLSAIIKNNPADSSRISLDDTISIPIDDINNLFTQDENHNFVVKIEIDKPNDSNDPNGQYVYAKINKYDAPSKSIKIPKWMCDKLGVINNDMLIISFGNIKKISKIIIGTIMQTINALKILEFLLKDRSLLYSGEKFIINMFEKTYELKVLHIFNEDIEVGEAEEINVGLLYSNSLTSEITFEVIHS